MYVTPSIFPWIALTPPFVVVNPITRPTVGDILVAGTSFDITVPSPSRLVNCITDFPHLVDRDYSRRIGQFDP